MITIEVVDRHGDPVYYAEVAIEFNGAFRGFSKDVRTNRNGEADFYDYDEGKGAIYVNGDKVYEGYISGHKRVWLD